MENKPLRLAAVGIALSTFLPTSFSQEAAIEEIVVTGSFIKRDSFDSSVPVTVVGAEDIEAAATPNLGEVLSNQTMNFGTDFQAATYSARGQIGTNSQANLRGLGDRATLDLIDGKRSANGNLNNSLPQIAIQRIDILTDGASALYGTDAVAGVVNVITNKRFEGTKFQFFRTQTDDRAWDSNVYEFMNGSSTDNGHFAFALSYSESSELQQVERPEFLRKGFSRSGTGNPGDWSVPQRDETGALTGEYTRLRDPGCGVENGSGTDVGVKNNYRSGVPLSDGNCGLQFGEFWNYANPQDKFSLWSNFEYKFSDDVHNQLDLIVSRLDTDSRGSPQNPGGRTEEFPIVLGDHPGNPYRAMTPDGQLLYARDADGDGVPDRAAGTDVDDNGVPDVILAADPFDSAAGIPFYEDVDVVALRIFGKLGAKPSAFNADGSNTGSATFDTVDYRISDTLTWTVPNSSWDVTAGFVYQRNLLNLVEKNTSQGALVHGLQGSLVPTPTSGGATYWNPFATQELYCQNGACAPSPSAFNPDNGEIVHYPNTQEVVDAINIEAISTEDTTFYTYDLMATGDLFELPTGDMMKTAFGYQYRNDELDVDLDDSRNRCDWHEGGCGYDYNESQDVHSVFFELLAPFNNTGFGDLELTLAGRFTDYGGAIGSSTDPKIAVLYQPISTVSLRASWSTAFIAPTIEQQFEPTDCGLQTAFDPIAGDIDSSNSFRVACNRGNPELEPETATVYNIGGSLALLDGDLDLGLDYAVYDFEDRIATTTMNQILQRDAQAYLAAGNTVGDRDQILAWNAGPGDQAIYRDSTGIVTRVDVGRLNAQQMKHVAWDIYARYSVPTDSYGLFSTKLNATYVDEYSYDLGFGIPPADGAGRQNEEVAEVPPMPEWNVNANLNWSLGGHLANFRVRWIDGYEMSFDSAGLQRAQQAVNGTLEQDPIMYMDLIYAYTFDGLLGDGQTRLELGAYNLADEFPDPILNLGGIETFVHDVRGRRYTFRLSHDF
ncbi:TonB-dependent receptor plug domain-containing protein [Proteobacteria bacterium 005FR1]|nr:TonB-dependent receptor plug domain-containing protein [Proteobacteria bacterium 005FR1]